MCIERQATGLFIARVLTFWCRPVVRLVFQLLTIQGDNKREKLKSRIENSPANYTIYKYGKTSVA